MRVPGSIILFFSTLTLTWSQTNPVNYPIYHIDLPSALETPGDIRLSSFGKQIRYIPFEAKQGSYLKQINEFLIADDFILIYDAPGKALKKFDLAGNYLHEFMTWGRGPGEFASIGSLDLNQAGEILVLKDGYAIEIYDKSGQLKSHFTVPVYVRTARWLANNRIVLARPGIDCAANNGFVIEIVDIKGISQTKLLQRNISGIENEIRTRTRLVNNNDGCYFFDRLCDTVYSISLDGHLSPRTIFHHDKNYIDRRKVGAVRENNLMASGSGYVIYDYFEIKDLIFIDLINKRTTSILIFDKTDGNCSNIMIGNNKLYPGFFNDIDLGPWFLPYLTFQDEWHGRIILPDDLFQYLDYYFKQPGLIDPSTYDTKVYQKLADFGNPVLMLVR